PARVKPSRQSNSPVMAVVSAIKISAGSSRWLPFPDATRRSAIAATSVAVIADVEVSGPAIANGNELRHATTAAATPAVRKVTATPYDSRSASGPEKISAAYESP